MAEGEKKEGQVLVLDKSKELSPLVQMAMAGNVDADKLEKLFAVQKDFELNEAMKSFNKDFFELSKEDLSVLKDADLTLSTKGAGAATKYAKLDKALVKLDPILTKHNFFKIWEAKTENGMTAVTCILGHIGGHSRSSSLSAMAETSGSKNNLQGVGSTMSYLKRYTLLPLLGIEPKDSDTDGAIPAIMISGEELEDLKKLIESSPRENELELVLEYARVDSLGKVAQWQYVEISKGFKGK